MEPLHNHTPSICCWNCNHFQRYSPSQHPKRCDGECRANPVPGALFVTDYIPDPQNRGEFGHNKETQYYWPHITCGLRMRCASFEKSTEPDLPKSPMSFDCQHTKPTLVNEWAPWIKPGKRSCFECHWFEPELCQRKHAAQPDNGCCLYNPPMPRQYHHWEEIVPRTEIGAPPSLRGALGLWCSRWEGPRPEIGYTNEDPEPVESSSDSYSRWEVGRERMVWLASLQLAKVKQVHAQAKERARKESPRIVTLDQVRKGE